MPAEDRDAVRSLVMPHFEAQDAHRTELARPVYELEQALPQAPLDSETWEKCRSGILSVVRHHVAHLTVTPAALSVSAVRSSGDRRNRYLRPVTVIDNAEADRQLGDILSRLRYIGPEPAPSEDEMMDMVVDEVRATRAKHAKGRSR